MLLFTGKGVIKNASVIGSHEIEVYQNRIIANDTGGIFVAAKKTEAFFNKDKVKLNIKLEGFNSLSEEGSTQSNLNELNFKCSSKELEVIYYAKNSQVGQLLFETDLTMWEFESEIVQAEGILQYFQQVTYVEVKYEKKRLTLMHKMNPLSFSLSELQSVHPHSENIFMITTHRKIYKIAVNAMAKKLLEQLILDLKKFKEIATSANSIELKLRDTTYVCFVKGQTLEIYNATTLKQINIFNVENIQLYLGETQLLIQHNNVLIACKNTVAKKLCSELGIIPKKLHQFNHTSFLHQAKRKGNIKDLVCFLEQGQYKFYSIASGSLIFSIQEENIKVSEQCSKVIVLPDGLLHVGCKVDFIPLVKTPTVYFSMMGFPSYFERLDDTIRIFIPGTLILEESVNKFYGRRTKQDGDMVTVYGMINLAICLPLQAYKNLFKEYLYESRLPILNEVHTQKVLLSRARNMSDLLLFEFFGQWQIILDYVQLKMKKELFTEEEITQFGLYLYHATFQQRKRMEEIANKYPQFMYALSQDLMVNPRLNQIYQKQQKDMFQLANQMKSQFTEVESLLSQITYIHFNNNNYQERLKEAQETATKKKIGGSVAAGIGISILSGGIGLIIPAMTTLTEWIHSEQRKELDAIQREKEFKKNEFLFKKAIDLILHMNDFTISYHVDMLNQFTYNNLRLEAEVLATDNTEAYKEKLLRQSINMYTKISLPIDYNAQLKPENLIASILTTNAEPSNKTVSLFLD